MMYKLTLINILLIMGWPKHTMEEQKKILPNKITITSSQIIETQLGQHSSIILQDQHHDFIVTQTDFSNLYLSFSLSIYTIQFLRNQIKKSITKLMSQITPLFRLTIIGLMIVAGSINTLAYKFQNTQFVFEGSFYKFFFHPYMQATTMFFGEFLALVVYFAMKKKDPQGFKMRMLEAKSKGKEIKMNVFLLAIPAFCDFITSTLQYVALNFISGSVYQMMRGGSIVTTFLFSVLFLKVKIQRNMKIGSAMAFIGVLIVGASNMIFADSSSGSSSIGLQIAGYILILISLLFNGFFFVFEQKLLSKYHLEPLQIVGYEGLFGLCIYAVLLPIISFIPCSFGQAACVFSHQSFPFLQKPGVYFEEAFSSGSLLFFCILGIFSIATFNVTGVTVTKYINALARSIADVARTIVIWTVGIIITLTAGATHPNYKWQLINAGAIIVELIGFVILIGGNLIYNKIIDIPGITSKRPTDESLLSGGDSEQDITKSV